jgi:hypothetical protein
MLMLEICDLTPERNLLVLQSPQAVGDCELLRGLPSEETVLSRTL